MASQHCKYQKIPLETGKNWVGATAAEVKRTRWIVTEKIHGANFAVDVSVVEKASCSVQFAKRTNYLDDNDDFYHVFSTGLGEKLRQQASNTLKALQLQCTNVSRMVVYGELFGGSYPHSDVTTNTDLQPVQHGVWYSPNLHFLAFDVLVHTSDNNSPPSGRFLNWDELQSLKECTLGIEFIDEIFSGTFVECMEHPVEFQSTIPVRLGFPALSGNFAEGVVIRAATESLSGPRWILKRKIEQFSETKYSGRLREFEKKALRKQQTQDSDEINEDLQYYELAARVTESRLQNVLSKTGPISFQNKVACRQALKMLMQDIVDCYSETFQGNAVYQSALKKCREDCKHLIINYLKSYT